MPDSLTQGQSLDARPMASIRPTISWPGMIGTCGCGQLAVDDVQVGTANAAGRHLDSNFTWPGLAIGELGPFERTPELLQHHRVHRVPSGFPWPACGRHGRPARVDAR